MLYKIRLQSVNVSKNIDTNKHFTNYCKICKVMILLFYNRMIITETLLYLCRTREYFLIYYKLNRIF